MAPCVLSPYAEGDQGRVDMLTGALDYQELADATVALLEIAASQAKVTAKRLGITPHEYCQRVRAAMVGPDAPLPVGERS